MPGRMGAVGSKPSVVSVTTYVNDPFTGTNGDAWNATNWQTADAGGTQDIQSNKGRMSAAANYSYSKRWLANLAAANCRITTTFVINGNPSGATFDLQFRANVTGYDDNMFRTELSDTGAFDLKRCDVGVFGASLGSGTVGTLATGDTITIDSTFNGSSISVGFKRNAGSLQTIAITDSNHASNTRMRLQLQSGANNITIDFDDFLVTSP
jgi:hypothetical protein